MASLYSTIELLERVIRQQYRLRNQRYVEGLYDLTSEAFQPAFGASTVPWFRDPNGRAAMREVREHIQALRLLRVNASRSSGVHFTAVGAATSNVVQGNFGSRGA